MDRVSLTPEEVAEALSVGRAKVYDLIRNGDLVPVKIGNFALSTPRRSGTDPLRKLAKLHEADEQRIPAGLKTLTRRAASPPP